MPADRLIDWPQVQNLGVRYTRQHLGRLEDADKFPQRVQLGPNRVAWWESEVLAWLQSRARGTLPQAPSLQPKAQSPAPEPDAADLELLHQLAAKFGVQIVVPKKQPERRRSGRSP